MKMAYVIQGDLSIEQVERRWARISAATHCPRCNGLMVTERGGNLLEDEGQRCIQCGERVDPIILHNRHRQRT